MSDHDAKKEQDTSTYVVRDKQSEKELLRLKVQDVMVTHGMGGPLPEQVDVLSLRSGLDIGCGSGAWVIDAARRYPELSLAGIDISPRMIDYARVQAAIQHVGERAKFHIMNALETLEFPDETFDIVNLRFGISYLSTSAWPRVLQEMLRVCKPGGIIRLTEPECVHQSNSVAHTQGTQSLICALFRAGHLFTEDTTGITAHLVPLLTQAGCQQIQTKSYTLEYRGGTPEGQAYIDDSIQGSQTLRPFLERSGCLPANFAALNEQALIDMQQSSFHASWNILNAWGRKP